MQGSHSHGARPLSRLRAALTGALVGLAVGCGGTAAGQSAPAPPLPVLPAAALPHLTATDSSLSLIDLTHDAPIKDFAGQLAELGYQRGTERLFKGAKGDFTNVVSRTLEFDSAGDAADYVALVDRRVADFYGPRSTVAPLSSLGRYGYLIRAASCGCHRETPLMLAVVSSGRRVTWLEGMGPGARPAGLRALLTQAP